MNQSISCKVLDMRQLRGIHTMSEENFQSIEGAAHTVPMKVDNMGFLLERMGADCAPMQFVRELTVNSLEAIAAAAEKSGEIWWDVDWNNHHLTGVYKLCIIDNGTGMTGPEMVKYINHLSCSGRTQSIDENFGVGAKIAAATRNHAGIIYLSWKDDKGAMIHLWRNPEDGTYGLRPLTLPNGKVGSWAPVDDAVKPKQIRDHGTMVVLLGNDDGEDTINAPEGASSPSRWITRYLNSRFFEFPNGVNVRAREGWTSESSDTNVARTVKGSKEFLERHKECSGQVDLGNATAHWWLLKDVPAVSQSSGANLPGGHAAVLHKNELYELQSGRCGTVLLQKFGVLVGHRRVVIYVEPKSQAGRITTDTSRARIIIDGESLPWADWSECFRDNFPPDISSMMNAIADADTANDHEKSIKDRLREISDLFRLRKFKPSRTGSLSVNDTCDWDGQSKASERSASMRPSSGGSLSRSGSGERKIRIPGGVYSLFLKDNAVNGEELPDHFDLVVKWVSADELACEDRAAHYVSEKRTLLINRDFRVFTDFVERWHARYTRTPGSLNVITQVVREWFEQTLREVIYSAEFLRGDLEWTDDSMDALLSDEALTASVLPRYHTEMAVRKTLGIKLGSVRDKEVA
jgi:hypothetical protein